MNTRLLVVSLVAPLSLSISGRARAETCEDSCHVDRSYDYYGCDTEKKTDDERDETLCIRSCEASRREDTDAGSIS